MAVRCPIHTDELFEANGTKAEHRLHPDNGCSRCLAEKEMAKTLDPAAVFAAAQERKQAASAAARHAARVAADAKAAADKLVKEAQAAENEANALLADAAGASSQAG